MFETYLLIVVLFSVGFVAGVMVGYSVGVEDGKSR
jgi:hypothetical protein